MTKRSATYSADVSYGRENYSGVRRETMAEAQTDLLEYLSQFPECEKAGEGTQHVTFCYRPKEGAAEIIHAFTVVHI